MAQNPERRAGQLALHEARKLRQFPHISESARWLTTHHQETVQREQTFEQVIQTMNASENNIGVFRDVGKLKGLITGERLPTLGQIASQMDDALFQAIEKAKEDYPSWADDHFKSPATPVWGMVIEGYGMYLGKKFGQADEEKQESINRAFVLAFEAVAFTEHRGSALVNDMIDWMREEKHDFPQEIAEQL